MGAILDKSQAHTGQSPNPAPATHHDVLRSSIEAISKRSTGIGQGDILIAVGGIVIAGGLGYFASRPKSIRGSKSNDTSKHTPMKSPSRSIAKAESGHRITERKLEAM